MFVIEVKNLVKTFKVSESKQGLANAFKNLIKPNYKKVNAVNDISFNIEKGKIMGFIGPNGAGKSTTIKMLVGILAPTSGEVLVNGLNPFIDRKKNAIHIGCVFGQRTQLWWDIPVIETFSIMKDLYHIPEGEYKKNIDMFNDVLSIGEFMNKPVRQLSLGQRMRADLSAALLHNPEIIFLDEPTIGLDISVKEKVRNFILEVNKSRATTIILTTHDISDIEQLSNELVVIDHGSIIYKGDLKNLKKTYGCKTTVAMRGSKSLMKLLSDKINLKDINIYYKDEILVEFNKDQYNTADIISKILSICSVTDISIKETSLESVVKKIYNSSRYGT